MLTRVIVVVDVVSGLFQEVLFTAELKGLGLVELIVIGTVGAFDMGIFLGMAFTILNEATAEASDEFTQLLNLEPRLAAELLTVVDSEDDLGSDTVGSQPGDHPQVEAEAIGPGALTGVGDELEAGVDI